jgi:folylpolyglutamate synthase/dihydropteroate synthase
MAREQGYAGEIEAVPTAAAALQRAEQMAGTADLICVTGSLSVVGEMRTVLGLAPAQAAYLGEAEVQAIQAVP